MHTKGQLIHAVADRDANANDGREDGRGVDDSADPSTNLRAQHCGEGMWAPGISGSLPLRNTGALPKTLESPMAAAQAAYPNVPVQQAPGDVSVVVFLVTWQHGCFPTIRPLGTLT